MWCPARSYQSREFSLKFALGVVPSWHKCNATQCATNYFTEEICVGERKRKTFEKNRYCAKEFIVSFLSQGDSWIRQQSKFVSFTSWLGGRAWMIAGASCLISITVEWQGERIWNTNSITKSLVDKIDLMLVHNYIVCYSCVKIRKWTTHFA